MAHALGCTSPALDRYGDPSSIIITGITPKADNLSSAETVEDQNLTGTAEAKAKNSMILPLPSHAMMNLEALPPPMALLVSSGHCDS